MLNFAIELVKEINNLEKLEKRNEELRRKLDIPDDEWEKIEKRAEEEVLNELSNG